MSKNPYHIKYCYCWRCAQTFYPETLVMVQAESIEDAYTKVKEKIGETRYTLEGIERRAPDYKFRQVFVIE